MRNVRGYGVLRRPFRAMWIFSFVTWGSKPQAIARRPSGAKNYETPPVLRVWQCQPRRGREYSSSMFCFNQVIFHPLILLKTHFLKAAKLVIPGKASRDRQILCYSAEADVISGK